MAEHEPKPEPDQGLPPPPSLPEWPIKWSCLGIRIETLLPVDPETLVTTMNDVARPAFSMAIVDVNALVAEELAIDPPSDLGEKLKAAQENPPEGGAWLTPEVVNMVLEGRALNDRDEEHRREAERRIQYDETCKSNIEEAQREVGEANQQLEEAVKRLQEFEDRMKELEAKQKELEATAGVGVAAAAAAPAAAKGAKKGSVDASAKGAPKGKASAKGSKAGSALAQEISPELERKELEDTITKVKALIQACEKKVKVAEYLDKKQEAEKSNALTTTRVYWCLGLGETAEALCQQATVKHMFKAIFNLAKKPPPPPELPQPVPLPPFVAALLALAKGTKLDHPARKIPVIEVLYEDPPSPPPVEGAEPAKTPTPSGSLPYAMVAKAVISGVICLQQQLESFSKLDANITGNYEIPEAIPQKDVNVTYYKAILNAVPTVWVSLPVILHCMVEQVAYYDCSVEDMEAVEVAKCNQRLAEGFDASIQRLGHGLSCMRRSSDLLNEIIEEIKAKQAAEDFLTVEEMLKNLLKIAGDEAEKLLEEEERLAAEAAAIAASEQNPSEQTRKSSRSDSGVKDGKKSSKKSSVDERKASATGKAGEKRGSIMMRPGSESCAPPPIVPIAWDPEDSEFFEDSSTRKHEEHSLVVHELSRVGQLERTVKQKALEFLESVDVVEVEKRMLSLLAYPGKNRACMPKIPFMSDEKRGACLEALRWLVGGKKKPTNDLYDNYNHIDIAYGRLSIVETLWRPDRPENITEPMNIAAIQRYKKLKMLLELLLEEEKRAFILPDGAKKEMSEGVTAKEELDDGLTEEERSELDEGDGFLADCRRSALQNKHASDAPLESNQFKLPTSFKPGEMFQSIMDRRFIEAFPDGLLGEVYGRARILLPYRVYRWDLVTTLRGWTTPLLECWSLEGTPPTTSLKSTPKFWRGFGVISPKRKVWCGLVSQQRLTCSGNLRPPSSRMGT